MTSRAYVPTPETSQKLVRELHDEYRIPAIKTALKTILEEGAIVFGVAKPAVRLTAYLNSTLDSEIEMILAPDYLEMLDAGMAPPLQPQVWFVVDEVGQKAFLPDERGRNTAGPFASEQEALVVAYTMGLLNPDLIAAYNAQRDGLIDPAMPLPPLPVKPFPSYWAQIYGLGRYKEPGKEEWSAFEVKARDFRNLVNTLNRRLDARAVEP